jgi:hypothetical protein
MIFLWPTLMFLSFLVIGMLSGCSPFAVNKNLYIGIECEKCVTPYGRGDQLNITINRSVSVNRMDGYHEDAKNILK